jgi:HEAT repeat protein
MFSTSSTPAAAELPQTVRQTSPGRPFRPGASGNPAGRRTKVVDIGALCRRHARAAVRALVAALASPDAQASVAAAKALIEHGHGTAIQHVALHMPQISVECRTAEPEASRTNGKDDAPGRWDA